MFLEKDPEKKIEAPQIQEDISETKVLTKN
jgi:hypothetical protein